MSRKYRREPERSRKRTAEPNPESVQLRVVKCKNCTRTMFSISTDTKLYLTSVYCPVCLNRSTLNLYPIGFRAEERSVKENEQKL